MNELLAVLGEGHKHDENNGCPAKISEGRYAFLGHTSSDNPKVKNYRLILKSCPLDTMTESQQTALTWGEMHHVDQRVVDVERSSADLVRLVLAVSSSMVGRTVGRTVGRNTS